jgi:hypothetical protein
VPDPTSDRGPAGLDPDVQARQDAGDRSLIDARSDENDELRIRHFTRAEIHVTANWTDEGVEIPSA